MAGSLARPILTPSFQVSLDGQRWVAIMTVERYTGGRASTLPFQGRRKLWKRGRALRRRQEQLGHPFGDDLLLKDVEEVDDFGRGAPRDQTRTMFRVDRIDFVLCMCSLNGQDLSHREAIRPNSAPLLVSAAPRTQGSKNLLPSSDALGSHKLRNPVILVGRNLAAGGEEEGLSTTRRE